MNILLGIILSYLLGSIPTAYIFGKAYKQIDIREHGSGNIGATNVFRVLGKVPGIIVLIIDIFKGFAAVSILSGWLGLESNMSLILMAVAVVSGHNWTIFLKFKGGKGIATSLGVLIGLALEISSIQSVLVCVLFLWLGSFLASGYVSLSSILAAVCLPIIMLLTGQPLEILLLGVIFSIFVVYRHRPNIKRLMDGKENRVNLPYLSQNK